MKASELVNGDAALSGRDNEVRHITADSREVKPGTLFAALPGTKADGARFIPNAIAAGAAAILVAADAMVEVDHSVSLIRSPSPRKALAKIASRFYGAQPATIVAVTGTSGKSSVADFARQIFESIGRRAASLGTIGLVKPGGATYGSLTTPDPITLAETLSGLAAENITHVALEASSHGLDQYRLDGVMLTAGAYTNIGRDHLDYHPTLSDYFAAKMRLFRELLPDNAPAVINMDGAAAENVKLIASSRPLRLSTVGKHGDTVRLKGCVRDGFAQRLTIEHDGRIFDVLLPLIGAYQVENALLAAGLAIATGENADAVIASLAHLRGVKGRLEIIGEHNGGLAIVDYAHKPEALEAALDACRPFATGRLISVFGCGGDRDRGKRPIMGAISVRKSDVTIITDDNPRTEIASAIRAEILADAPGAIEIGDRALAIEHAVGLMQPGDVVMVAGKGHETGQIVGNDIIPFSDHETIAAAIASVAARTGGGS